MVDLILEELNCDPNMKDKYGWQIHVMETVRGSKKKIVSKMNASYNINYEDFNLAL